MITMTKYQFEKYLNETIKKFHKDYECILVDYKRGVNCKLKLFIFKATYPNDNYADIFGFDRAIYGKIYRGDIVPTNMLNCSMSSSVYEERFKLFFDKIPYDFLSKVAFNPDYIEGFFKKCVFDLEMG